MKVTRKQKNRIIALAVALAVLISVAPWQRADAASFWKKKWVTFFAYAAESITTGDLVAVSGTTSYTVRKVDADDATRQPAAGVAGNSASAGERVQIVVVGVLGGRTNAGVTPYGTPLYADDTELGGITNYATGVSNQQVGHTLPNPVSSVTEYCTDYFISVLQPYRTDVK